MSPIAAQSSTPIDSVGAPSLDDNRSGAVARSLARLGARRGPYLADLATVIGFLAWPALSIRTLLLLAATQAFRSSDLRGYASDVVVATLTASLTFVPWPRLRRLLLALAFGALALVSLANFEHVRANGSSFDLAAVYLIFDGTFARGSVFGFRAIHQAGIAVVPVVLAVILLRRSRTQYRYRVTLLESGLALAGCLLFEVVAPVPSDRIRWRQQHPLTENAARIWHRSAPSDFRNADSHAPLPPAYVHLHQQDLTGTSALTSAPPIKNVLLVLIEGLSRGHIYDMRAAARGPGWLPNLASFASRHVDFTQYMALQRQTNRAEYTALCGDLPNIVTADSEMDIYSATPASQRAECLPRFLRRHGLNTTYLQAAPITFMGKDEFLPNAGFSSVLDTKWFSKAYATSGWGVDDRAFFEQASELILRQKMSGEPWFLTLLTVGTHHPYLVPPEWHGRSQAGAFEDSLMYLDAVLKRFFTVLEEGRVLEDTLVLITGDESAGYILENETAEMLSQHSVPLIAAYPGDRPTRVHERFSHSDLALSVSDALGLGESSPFHGRSIFRHYPEGRRLVFGNAYLAKLGAVGPRDELLFCDTGLAACSGFLVGKEDAFLSELTPRGVGGDEPDSLRQAVFALDRKVPTEAKARASLLVPQSLRLRPKADPQMLFYGKYHDVRAPTRASVQLAFEVTEGPTVLHHDIAMAAGTQVLYDTPSLLLLPGMGVEWDYDLILRAPVEQLEFRMDALNRGSNDSVVDFREATVKFSEQRAADARAGAHGSTEIAPRRFSVTLSKAMSLNLLEERTLLSRASCVKDGENGTWLVEGCAAGFQLFGPYFPLPANSTVRIKFRMKGDQGRATAQVDVVGERGESLLGEAKSVTLSAGQTEDLELVVRLTRAHADVETRLRLSDLADFRGTITEGVLDVSP